MPEIHEFTVNTRSEGEDILDSLHHLIETYGEASVADLYSLVGLVPQFTDNHWGWRAKDIVGATVPRVRNRRNEWRINLPNVVSLRAIPLKDLRQEHDTKLTLSVLDAHNLGKPVTVTYWQLDTENVPTGGPDTYVGTLEGFWHNDEGLMIKLQGLPQIHLPTKLFRVEVYIN